MFSIGTFLISFSWLSRHCEFGEEGDRGRALVLKSHHSKGTCHQHEVITVDADLDHLGEVWFSGSTQ
jgi:hypothetical protein